LDAAVGPIFPDAFCVFVNVSVASVDPASRFVVLTLTLTVSPSGGSVPLDGVTLMNGLSELMVYVSSLASVAFLPMCGNPVGKNGAVNLQLAFVPGVVTGLRPFGCGPGGGGAMTSTLATSEYALGSPPHVAYERTR